MMRRSAVKSADAVERSNEFLVGADGATSHQIEDERDGGQHGGPVRTEVDRTPRFITSYLAYNEEADIPSHDEQGVECTEKSLRLAVAIDKDGIGAKSGCGQQNGQQGPHIEMMLADGVGEPEVVDLRHIHAAEVEGANLRTETNDRQDDGHYQENGLFTLPHKNKDLAD